MSVTNLKASHSNIPQSSKRIWALYRLDQDLYLRAHERCTNPIVEIILNSLFDYAEIKTSTKRIWC